MLFLPQKWERPHCHYQPVHHLGVSSTVSVLLPLDYLDTGAHGRPAVSAPCSAPCSLILFSWLFTLQLFLTNLQIRMSFSSLDV